MKKGRSGAKVGKGGATPSRLIDARIKALGDWRGETLARVRALIKEADPGIVEEWKWRGVPVWEHAGIVCTGETYKDKVKMTFAKGAALEDPKGLFNSSLEGNVRRAIDFYAGDKIDEKALKALIRAAVALNTAKAGAKAKPIKLQKGGKVAVLSGGNPRIAKADGNAPVQAYIAAMTGWKRGIGRRLDALIVRSVPKVRKAVKWNSPLYGNAGEGWFLGLHVFTHYIKVTFFRGASLRPVPPGGTAHSKDSRWIDIREGDELDEARMAKWVKQAAKLPGFLAPRP